MRNCRRKEHTLFERQILQQPCQAATHLAGVSSDVVLLRSEARVSDKRSISVVEVTLSAALFEPTVAVDSAVTALLSVTRRSVDGRQPCSSLFSLPRNGLSWKKLPRGPAMQSTAWKKNVANNQLTETRIIRNMPICR